MSLFSPVGWFRQKRRIQYPIIFASQKSINRSTILCVETVCKPLTGPGRSANHRLKCLKQLFLVNHSQLFSLAEWLSILNSTREEQGRYVIWPTSNHHPSRTNTTLTSLLARLGRNFVPPNITPTTPTTPTTAVLVNLRHCLQRTMCTLS